MPKLKKDSDGLSARLKDPLGSSGNFENISYLLYTELYVLVVYFELIRLLLALSISNEWLRRHVHIKGVPLYTDTP